MAVLPEGFALPPLPHLLALLVGIALVGRAFARRRPAATDRHVVALAPWMVVGAATHVLYAVDALPTALRPLGGTPAVYGAVAVVAGGIWLLLDSRRLDVPRALGTIGAAVAALAVALTLAVGTGRPGGLALRWPAIGLVVAILVAVLAWALFRRVSPDVRTAGLAGPLVVLAHALDAVSTTVGVDVLGFGERTPLSRLLLDLAAGLPTADVLGSGWLFVLVKLAVAGFVLAVLADYVEEEPTEGYLLLTLVAAVGLGPGVHNLLLFSVA